MLPGAPTLAEHVLRVPGTRVLRSSHTRSPAGTRRHTSANSLCGLPQKRVKTYGSTSMYRGYGGMAQFLAAREKNSSRRYAIVPLDSSSEENRPPCSDGGTRKNGRTPRTRWTYSASRGARSRRPSLLDLRRRQSSRRIRRQPLPVLLQRFPGTRRYASSQWAAAPRGQSRRLQIPPLAQRADRGARRSNPPRKIGQNKTAVPL